MQIIVVSGKVQDVGKTTLVRRFIKNLRYNVGVIKTSVKSDLETALVTAEPEMIMQENTDTALFKDAGATQVVYLESSPEDLREAFQKALELVGDCLYLIIEGNSILDYINPDLIFYIDRSGVEAKPSALKAEARANIILDSDELHTVLSAQPRLQPIPFRVQGKYITCLQSHLLAKAVDMDLQELGKRLDEAGIKLRQCQLGVF